MMGAATTGRFQRTLPAMAVLCSMLPAAPAHAFGVPFKGNDVEARVGAMIDNMSLQQKFEFIRVNDGHMLPLLPSQGLAGTVAYDSSMGVHVGLGTFGTQFPSQSALAATWSINRAQQFGLAIGYETRQAGAQQMLSPGLNMFRTPYNGRNAEYVSGEDPFLGAVFGPAIVNAIQAQGIQAAAKHYVANDQEANRHLTNVTVDERTLREIYLPGFESAVKNASPASVMCAFNKINGDYGCESHHLITEVLKGEWGYQGFVMSDFNSIHHPQKAAWAGADLDMPSALAFTDQTMYDLVYSNQVPMVVLDDKVRRNLRAMVSFGFDKALPVPTALDTSYGNAASLAVAREGIVLLRNDSASGSMPVLPLATNARVAVIGNMAQQEPASPFGTAWAPTNRHISELGGLQQLNVDPANVTYLPALSLNPAEAVWYQPGATARAAQPGLKAEYFANTELAGSAAVTRIEPGLAWNFMTGANVTAGGSTSLAGFAATPGAFSARFTGTIKPTVTGEQVFKVRADGAYKLWVDGELVLDVDGTPIAGDVVNAYSHSGKTARLKAGALYTVKLEYRRLSGAYFPVLGSINGIQMSWASLAAPDSLAGYDAVVVAVGKNAEYEGEGADVAYELPEYQSDLIRNVAKMNPNTVVVVHGGGPSEMGAWSNKAAAILQAWYPGQFGGQAVAEILYGTVNPSGKLPVTIGGYARDYPTSAGYGAIANYQPSGNFADAATNPARKDMAYSEGVFMGYRGFDRTGVKPLYPFGFGLSYTTFAYGGLKLSSSRLAAGSTVNATFTLTNTGTKAGHEVAQLYVRPASPQVARPKQELKGFAKVFLRAGETKTVSIPVDARSLAYYATASGAWQVDAGKYTLHVGSSSAELPLKATLTAPSAMTLSTASTNPLPAPVQEAVQVGADRAY